MIETAKRTLGNYKHAWSSYPIYVKATAGMRELPEKKRDATIDAVRRLLKDNNTCPFDFANKEQARVIAGEEEAAYAWVAVNFVDGALLEATDSPFGTATPSRARGSMEMGGSSAQISFYKPEQDILAGLFKLQLGGRSHINIYAHSFLHYGRVSSRRAYWEYLAKKAGCWTYDGEDPQAAVPCVIEDHCLVGAEPRVHLDQLESVTGQFGLTPPLHFGPVNANVTIKGTGIRTRDRYARCKDDVRAALFDTKFNEWCEYSHRGQCAFAGVYQPALPTQKEFGNFVLLGNYVDLFNMLGLPETTNVHEMGDAALKVCGDTDVPFPAKDHHTLSENELCFVAAYAYETFVSGHGFDARVNFTTVTETTYNGATVSVGWQLGAMLYEINALPWSFDAGPNCSVDAGATHGLFLYTQSSLGGGSVGYALIGALVVVLGLAGAFRRRKETLPN